MAYEEKYREVFDYLSAPDLPTEPEHNVVFGCQDEQVARAVGDLIIPDLVKIVIITGGAGKDSGTIFADDYDSEAHYLADKLQIDAIKRGYAVPDIVPKKQVKNAREDYNYPKVILEERAIHGFDNASYSLDILNVLGEDISSVTGTFRAPQAKRLGETLRFVAWKKYGLDIVVHQNPSSFNFDPRNNAHRNEAAKEMQRLIKWPVLGRLLPQDDLPQDLVDFVIEAHGDEAPPPPNPLHSTLVHLLPRKQQARILSYLANRGNK
jgi:hypothetical protein